MDKEEIQKRLQNKIQERFEIERKPILNDKAKEAIKNSDRKYECLRCNYRGYWIWENSRLHCPKCDILLTIQTGNIREPKWYESKDGKIPPITLEWQDNGKLIIEGEN